MTGEFSWDEVYARRRVLAEDIRRRIGLSFGLGGGVTEPFGAVKLTDQTLADQPMWRVPFYVIADMMEGACGSRVIDHAWWLVAEDGSGEPWGFVTEPYIEPAKAQRLVQRLSGRLSHWGVEVRALPPAQSAWLPGSTVPIVTTAGVGCLCEFLRFGVAGALERLEFDEAGQPPAITSVARDIAQVDSSIRGALDGLAARIAGFEAEEQLAAETCADLERWRELQIALFGEADKLHQALMRLRAAAAELETVTA
jgi:hypothetical protein